MPEPYTLHYEEIYQTSHTNSVLSYIKDLCSSSDCDVAFTGEIDAAINYMIIITSMSNQYIIQVVEKCALDFDATDRDTYINIITVNTYKQQIVKNFLSID